MRWGDQWSVAGEQLVKTANQRKFNEVFRVEHKTTGASGICKRLQKTARNEHLWPLLRQEARLSFTEPGLPQTLLYEENDQEIVLIRNFQQGIPLDVFWKQVPRKERIGFIKSLVEKLVPVFGVLRQKEIVHCDIKPSNIIIDGNTADFNASLIDFGMAVVKEDPIARKTLFALGYSAPELILNKLSLVDHTTDIFALGISIWQLFAGTLPLMHANPGIMTNLQITHPLPEHRTIPKEIFKILQQMCVKHSFQKPPHHLEDAVVEQYLKAAMEKRFQSLHEVSAALQQARQSPLWAKLFRPGI